MVLRRPEICRLIEFNSWTGVQRWLSDVASEPFRELVEDYLRPFDQRGEKSPLNYEGVKNHIINHSSVLETMVQMRVAELQGGIERRLPNKAGCTSFPQHTPMMKPSSSFSCLTRARN